MTALTTSAVNACDDEAEPRIEAIRARLAVLSTAQEAYTSEDIAKAGCYVTMDYYGNVEIERGLVRSDDEVEAGDEGEDVTKAPKAITRRRKQVR